jgi:hypothetical protein
MGAAEFQRILDRVITLITQHGGRYRASSIVQEVSDSTGHPRRDISQVIRRLVNTKQVEVTKDWELELH